MSLLLLFSGGGAGGSSAPAPAPVVVPRPARDCGSVDGPLHCPTLFESQLATLNLMPRGRAWPANDDGGMLTRFLAWLGALGAVIPLPAAWPFGFGQAGFVAALGAVRNYLETRLCALRLEFWCATMSETRDLWMAEYGLPDACDPFPDLCTKVAAVGGTRCDYFAAIAARSGWSIECLDLSQTCGDQAGCARAGCSQAGAVTIPKLEILVNLHESPSYAGGFQTPTLAGLVQAGQPFACPADVAPLKCILERIVPAHVEIVYSPF